MEVIFVYGAYAEDGIQFIHYPKKTNEYIPNLMRKINTTYPSLTMRYCTTDQELKEVIMAKEVIIVMLTGRLDISLYNLKVKMGTLLTAVPIVVGSDEATLITNIVMAADVCEGVANKISQVGDTRAAFLNAGYQDVDVNIAIDSLTEYSPELADGVIIEYETFLATELSVIPNVWINEYVENVEDKDDVIQLAGMFSEDSFVPMAYGIPIPWGEPYSSQLNVDELEPRNALRKVVSLFYMVLLISEAYKEYGYNGKKL